MASGGACARRSPPPPASFIDSAADIFIGQTDAGWPIFKVDPFDAVYLAGFLVQPPRAGVRPREKLRTLPLHIAQAISCLLYTSDAADE